MEFVTGVEPVAVRQLVVGKFAPFLKIEADQ
jgi:hypothetical protein